MKTEALDVFENVHSLEIEKEIKHQTDSLAAKQDINELKVLIEKNSKEHFKWMIVFFVPLYLTLLGFIVAHFSRIF